MVKSICQGSNASKLCMVAFIYTAHIHLHAFEVHQLRVFCIVPACWSRDKAADHMLDSIGHRCAPNRSQGERDGKSSRCGRVFLDFDANKICHEKKNALFM